MKNNPNIKAKIIIGYSLSIIIIIASGFITYHSFTRLLNSVEVLSKPDRKLIRLNHMITDISETERNLRSYILSDNKEHLESYEAKLDSIKLNLNILKSESADEPGQLIKLDSIGILLKAKYDALDDLGILQKRSSTFSSKALKRIRATPIDSAKFDTTLLTYTETIKHIQPPPEVVVEDDENEENNSDERGIFNAIKNLFSSKKEVDEPEEGVEENQEIEGFYTETKVTVDTSVVSSYKTDTVVANIRKILADMQKKETALNQLLTSKQLEILEQDKLIMNKLRILLTDLERAEILNAEKQTQEAKKIAGKFSFTILAIGIFGLLAGTTFLLLIIHDINKSNYLKVQLEKAKEKAEFLAKVKEEFLSNMSHEIRTPLNAILGFTEQLLMTPLQKTQNEYLQSVHQSSTHLLSTVNDILDYSKIEAGKLTIEKIPFKLRQVIEEVHSLFRLKAEAKNLSFNYFVDEDCPKGVLGDPFRLKQILFNLLGNALKFTDTGSINIICKCQKSFTSPKRIILSITIKDTGIGIRKNKIAKIFEGFQQADSSTTREYGGTGLGLTICKNLAKLQNGKLEVESEEGKGSAFTIVLPYEICEIKEEIVLQKKPTIAKNILENLNILMVDDDAINLLLLNTILKKYAAETVEAKNGTEGLEKLVTNKFDLIITDIQMPKMSGFEFTKELRSLNNNQNANIPVFALSAHVTNKEIDQAERSGITEILSKPYKEAALLDKIIEVLGLSNKYEASNSSESSENVEIAILEEVVCDNAQHEVDFSGFDNFIKGDKNALINLLNTLVSDQKKNVKLLRKHHKLKNYDDSAALAHKMRASFAYLKAEDVVRKLTNLETGLKDSTNKEVFDEIPVISNDIEKIIEAIETSIEKLRSDVFQSTDAI